MGLNQSFYLILLPKYRPDGLLKIGIYLLAKIVYFHSANK